MNLLQSISVKGMSFLLPWSTLIALESEIKSISSPVTPPMTQEINYQRYISDPEAILKESPEIQEEIKRRLLEYFQVQEQLQHISEQDLLFEQKRHELREQERTRELEFRREAAKVQEELYLKKQLREEELNAQRLANAEKATAIKETLEEQLRKKAFHAAKESQVISYSSTPALEYTNLIEEKPWWVSALGRVGDYIYQWKLEHRKYKPNRVERVFGGSDAPLSHSSPLSAAASQPYHMPEPRKASLHPFNKPSESFYTATSKQREEPSSYFFPFNESEESYFPPSYSKPSSEPIVEEIVESSLVFNSQPDFNSDEQDYIEQID